MNVSLPGARQEQLKQAAFELAVAGQQGLYLKDPSPKQTLQAFPGAAAA